MSEQEQPKSDDQHTDEQMQDLDVAKEQQDDLTGDAAQKRREREIQDQ